MHAGKMASCHNDMTTPSKRTKKATKATKKNEQLAPVLTPQDAVLTNNVPALEKALSTILDKASARARGDLVTVLSRTASGMPFGDAIVGTDVNWGTVQAYKKWHPQFYELWEASRACGDGVRQERREAEADRRAMQGWEEPVFQGGVQVGAVRKYSDKLLELQLKANNPKKYAPPPAAQTQNACQQIVIIHRDMEPEPKTVTIEQTPANIGPNEGNSA